MKRTSSMIYNNTPNSDECYRMVLNHANTYQTIQNTFSSLQRKVDKGQYNGDQAIDAIYRAIDSCMPFIKSQYKRTFTVQERFTTAVNIRNDFERR